jgi:hypothetical protein
MRNRGVLRNIKVLRDDFRIGFGKDVGLVFFKTNYLNAIISSQKKLLNRP